jgi:hypothetical protein
VLSVHRPSRPTRNPMSRIECKAHDRPVPKALLASCILGGAFGAPTSDCTWSTLVQRKGAAGHALRKRLGAVAKLVVARHGIVDPHGAEQSNHAARRVGLT